MLNLSVKDQNKPRPGYSEQNEPVLTESNLLILFIVVIFFIFVVIADGGRNGFAGRLVVAGGLGVVIEVLADGGLVNLDLLAKFFTSLNSQNVTSLWIKVYLLLHLQFGILKS